MRTLPVVNATQFFNRTSYLYSVGDIRLPTPIPMNTAVYTMLFVFLWSIPYFFLFVQDSGFSIFKMVVMLLPPIILGRICTKPIFGDMNLFDFAGSMFDFFASEPAGWLDSENSKMKDTTYHVSHEIYIGRRRDLRFLSDIIAGDVKVFKGKKNKGVKSK